MNPNIDMDYWLNIVSEVAQASTCRKKLGCVLVKHKHIVGVGYVGSVSGDEHCFETRNDEQNLTRTCNCLLVPTDKQGTEPHKNHTCIRTVHAEMNAVLKCSERGEPGNHGRSWIHAYSTYEPCLVCLKTLLQIGVRYFTFENKYKDLWRDIYLRSLPKDFIHHYCYNEI